MNRTQCPIEHKLFLSQRENTVLHWAFKVNSSPDAAETWDLKGHMLKVKPMLTYNDKTWTLSMHAPYCHLWPAWL